MPTFANAALHVALERGDDVALMESHPQQILDDEPEHDGRTTDESNRVLDWNRYSRLLEETANHAHVSRPWFSSTIGVQRIGVCSIIVRAIDGEMAFHSGRSLPLVKLRHVHQLIWRFRAVEDLYASVLFAVCERVDDHGAQRDEADSTGNKDEVLAAILFHRKAVAVGSAHRELVAGLERMQRRGATAHLPDGKECFLLGGTGRKRGWELTHPEKRHLGELSRKKAPEGALFGRVFKVPEECIHFLNLVHDAIKHRDLRQIHVLNSIWEARRWRRALD